VPVGIVFAYDFLGFSDSVAVGGATTVALYLPSGANPTSYYKYGVTEGNLIPHWYEFLYDGETGAEISGNVVTLHLVDGKRGDNDLTANGMIEEPGAPAWPDTTTVGVNEKEEVPMVFSLSQNFPNPFNPKTVIEYTIPGGAHPHVLLQAFDVLGRVVMTLVDEVQGPGKYRAIVDASHLASGVYFYRMRAGDFMQAKKLLLVK
jgi:hypothetical protein